MDDQADATLAQLLCDRFNFYEDKVSAIRARIQGEFDNPHLRMIGPTTFCASSTCNGTASMKNLKHSSTSFIAEDGHQLRVTYSNMGDPYREGIQLTLETGSHEYVSHPFLEDYEAIELRNLLNRLYPPKGAAS